MKSILRFFNLSTLILLVLFLGLRDVQPAQADNLLDQTITVITYSPASAAYGESFTVEATASSGLEVIYSASGDCTNVGAIFTTTSGDGSCTVQYHQAGDDAYNPAPQVTEDVAAQPAAITVMADSKSKTYSDADPALTYMITGGVLVDADDFTGALTRDPGETVGEYAIMQGTLALSDNYNLTFVGATLEITSPQTATPTSEPDTATPTPSPATVTPTRIPNVRAQSVGPGLFVSAYGNDQGGANSCANAASPCRTIQQAITKATSGDTIYVASGPFNGTGTSPIVTINKNISISGGWDGTFDIQSGLTVLDGQDARSDVVVNTGVTASIEKFIVTNSKASGIKNLGTLTVQYSMIYNNDKPYPDANGTSASDGGGIHNTGTLAVVNTAIYDNFAKEHSGGGIFNTGSLTVTNSTIANNYALHGGGIMYTPTGYAGTPPSVVLNNVTIKGNSGPYGSSIYRAANNEIVSLVDPVLYNTILANNNCHGSLTSANNNLIYQSNACTISGSYATANPLLGTLSTANGYFPLLNGSPAIDAGSPSTPGSGGGACEAGDQLGTIRPTDGDEDTVAVCDIGAYEADPSVAGLTPAANAIDIDNGSPQSAELATAFSNQLSALVKDQFGNPISGITVTFTAPASGASGTFADSVTNTTTAITDTNGIATAAVFTANSSLGSYPINASVSGIPGPVQFRLANTSVVTSIDITAGSQQSAAISTAFQNLLKVLVKDQSGNPISGVTVTFTAPASGASGTFADSGTNISTANTDENGIATAAIFTANTVEGGYMVNASVSSIPTPLQLQLANVMDLVLYASPLGNNLNSCTMKTAPCLTIKVALSKAAAGNTIKLAVGTYTDTGNEVISIQKSITLLGGWDTTFTTQNGISIIDGQGVRRGIVVSSTLSIVALDRLTIQHGYHSSQGAGIYNNSSNLTLTNSIVSGNVSRWMAGGIFNQGIFTINNTSISGNIAGNSCCSGGGGGGGIQNASTMIINNSVVSGNAILGSFSGSGILNGGTLTLNSTIVSNNTGAEAIAAEGGNLSLNNSTVIGNSRGGIVSEGYYQGSLSLNNSTISNNNIGIGLCYGIGINCPTTVSVQNSILAGNVQDCASPITSSGYNLLGQTCNPYDTTGDIVVNDAKLGKLIGSPGYLPLLPDSPAVNAGNPATCLATDERGVVRPQGGRCDIGSYEYTTPGPAVSVGYFEGSNQSSASGAPYTIPLTGYAIDSLGSPVPGVVFTFTAPSSGPGGSFADTHSSTTTAVTNTSGLAAASTFTANNQPGSYNVTASVTGLPGSITFALNNLLIPSPLSPAGDIAAVKPKYTWVNLIGATQYQYELWRGTKLIFTKTVDSSVCGSATCSNTAINQLQVAAYNWRVRAMVGGVWQSFSAYQPFVFFKVKPGLWKGYGLDFYVTRATATKPPAVVNFAIYINITGCGKYKITHKSTNIKNLDFSFKGKFYASGTFKSLKQVVGKLGLDYYHIPGCGYLKGGPFFWKASWKNLSQPTSFIEAEVMPLLPGLELEQEAASDYYTVERVNP